ncbi:MAG: multidrug efflux MFS transporter MdtH [Paludibacterium sp.]|uniref:multidrug efflux MFS transporter MdtH n=1 Tax=Paludibacterium sp. TaxID=1917523 RepID=UPI0025EF247A|nr:multidrug efflux MFS transporter MdtH [Paludibacterium sp.]MBV8048186.1 multidrug efflux MFS transporter MdtH [Paludibacterium sp.]MBV8645902.1 multidrug efflux MFS transporter MdtH [Paludibacterium sp.]
MSPAGLARRRGKWFILLDSQLVLLGFYMVIPMISVHFVDGLGWAAASVGVALGARQLTQQGLGLFGGALADRFGAKPLILCGMLLRAVGFALMALAQAPWVLILSCVLAGLGGVLFDPPRSALVAKLVRANERAHFYSILMVQESAGAVTGALMGAWLLRFDFRWVGFMGMGVFLLTALVNAVLLPAYRVASTRDAAPLTSLRRVLADRGFMRFVLTLSGYYVLCVQVLLLMPVLMKKLTGSTAAVGWMFTLEACLSLSLLYPLARLGERHLLRETRMLIGLAFMTVSWACLTWIRLPLPAFCALGLLYLGTLIVEPAREAYVASLANPQARASYMGASRLGLALGGAAGYAGGGWLYDMGERLSLHGLPMAVLALIGAATWWTLYRQFFRESGTAAAKVAARAGAV